MKTLNLIQGSPEWHAHRTSHKNASDAPAVLGESTYVTRSQLLQRYFSGASEEVNSYTQKLFDDGHRFEALARPLAEAIIGEELYPITGSLGELSASFDGITMAEDIIFEHKTLNNTLKSVMVKGCTGADLPAQYRIQMEQQLYVSGAEKVLFMASTFNSEDVLVEERHCWYKSDPVLREKILKAWEQFDKDLANFKLSEPTKDVKADAIMLLPTLAIQITGEVVKSNLPAFKSAAIQYIKEIKTDLKTDEDFANAEATVKFLIKGEKELDLAKNNVISQTTSIEEAYKTIDWVKEQMRDKRLLLEKLLIKEKNLIRENMVFKAKEILSNHLNALEVEIKPYRLPVLRADFVTVMKNKRTLISLQDAVDSELARCKIDYDTLAKEYRDKLNWFNEFAIDFSFIFHDMQTLLLKPFEDFQVFVKSRIENYKSIEKINTEKMSTESVRDSKIDVVINKEAISTLPVESNIVVEYSNSKELISNDLSEKDKLLNIIDLLSNVQISEVLKFVSKFNILAN